MATIPETVIFCGAPFTGTTTSGVAQAVTMPTITLPENNKTFVSVVLKLWWTDAATAATNVSGRRIDLGLNGGAKTAYNATQAMNQSGEAIPGYTSYDVTSQFTSQWSGTSMTCELDVTITGPVTRNICAQLVVTYTHDDTATTRVKTVMIPLLGQTAGIGTSKPASLATIPALDTELPEASKTILGTWVDLDIPSLPPSSVDVSYTMEISSLGTHTTGLIENALITSQIVHYAWNASFPTNATQTWHLWTSSLSYSFHPTAKLIVTYTYDASATTAVYHSLLIPMEISSVMGASTYPSRATCDVWVGEASPTTKALAAYVWWQSTGSLSGLNGRIGTGSYLQHTDSGSVYAGSNTSMWRNDSAYTLAQGRNPVSVNLYTASGGTNCGNIGVLLLVCYTAPVMPGGVGAHTRTVWMCLHDMFDANTASASVSTRTVNGVSQQVAAVPSLPDDHFICAIGLFANVTPLAGANLVWSMAAQKDSGDGWHSIYSDVGCSDAETGPVVIVASMDGWFKRWFGDPDTARQDAEVARRWLFMNSTVNAAAQAVIFDAFTLTTFHLHTWSVAGTVSGSNGGLISLRLHRSGSGEMVKQTTRTGDGAFSFAWYDATEEMYVDAYEDNTYLGRSAVALAV